MVDLTEGKAGDGVIVLVTGRGRGRGRERKVKEKAREGRSDEAELTI